MKLCRFLNATVASLFLLSAVPAHLPAYAQSRQRDRSQPAAKPTPAPPPVRITPPSLPPGPMTAVPRPITPPVLPPGPQTAAPRPITSPPPQARITPPNLAPGPMTAVPRPTTSPSVMAPPSGGPVPAWRTTPTPAVQPRGMQTTTPPTLIRPAASVQVTPPVLPPGPQTIAPRPAPSPPPQARITPPSLPPGPMTSVPRPATSPSVMAPSPQMQTTTPPVINRPTPPSPSGQAVAPHTNAGRSASTTTAAPIAITTIVPPWRSPTTTQTSTPPFRVQPSQADAERQAANRQFAKDFVTTLPREAIRQATPVGDALDAQAKFRGGNYVGAAGSGAIAVLSSVPVTRGPLYIVRFGDKQIFTAAGYLGRNVDHYTTHSGFVGGIGSAKQFANRYRGPALPESLRPKFGDTFDRFEYHDIIMQFGKNVEKLGSTVIHSADNKVPLPKPLHDVVSELQRSTNRDGIVWRDWVHQFGADRQRTEGLELLNAAIRKFEADHGIKLQWQ